MWSPFFFFNFYRTMVDEVVMNAICVVTVSVVGTLLAVCFAAVLSKKFRITIDYGVDGFKEDDRVGLVSEPRSNKEVGYGAVASDVEDGSGGVAAVSRKEEHGEEDSTQDDGGCVYAADVGIRWIGTGTPMAIVNETYKVAYQRAKLEVDWNIKPWIISWDVGKPDDKEFGAVMVGPLTGCVYPSGKVRAYLVDAVSPKEAHNEYGTPRVVFYQKKRSAE